MSSADKAEPRDGAIVVVAKCPVPGKSKTRLIPLLGLSDSATLAKAMLSDVLLTLEKCVSPTIVFKKQTNNALDPLTTSMVLIYSLL
jgi:glycosyltransferase A (GT-A) superfamily protein (DUF2064 family)